MFAPSCSSEPPPMLKRHIESPMPSGLPSAPIFCENSHFATCPFCASLKYCPTKYPLQASAAAKLSIFWWIFDASILTSRLANARAGISAAAAINFFNILFPFCMFSSLYPMPILNIDSAPLVKPKLRKFTLQLSHRAFFLRKKRGTFAFRAFLKCAFRAELARAFAAAQPQGRKDLFRV